MKKSISKVLTLMLSFVMVFTSMVWIGVGEVNADNLPDSIKIHASIGSENAVGVKFVLDYQGTDPDFEDVEIGETDNNGDLEAEIYDTAVFAPGNYLLDLENGEKSTYSMTPIAVVLGDNGSDNYVVSVGTSNPYDGSSYMVELTAAGGDEPEPEVLPTVEDFNTLDADTWKKFGIEYKDIDFNKDVIVDVRNTTDTGNGGLIDKVNDQHFVYCKFADVTAGSSLSADASSALEAAKEDGKRMVFICYSGNAFAKRAMQWANEKGWKLGPAVDSQATYLIGGANGVKGGDYKANLGIGYGEVTDSDVILDVRSKENYEAGHLPGAVHVDVTDEGGALSDADKSNMAAALAAVPADRRLVIVCNSGNLLAYRAMSYFMADKTDAGLENLKKVSYLIGGDKVIPAEDKVTGIDYVEAQKDANLWGEFGISRDKLSENDYILDVRASRQYDSAHFAGSKNVDVTGSGVTEGGYVEKDSDLATDLDAAYEESGDKRIVIVCVRGQVLAARAMEYFNEVFFNGDGVDLNKVTYLIGGATDNIKADGTIDRTLGKSKARTMTTNIDMSKYDKGKVVKAWIPVPQTEDYQTISNENFSAPGAKDARFTTESVNGNKMLYLEWAADAEPSSRKATLTFDAQRYEAGHSNLFGLEGTDVAYPDSVKEYITKESQYVKWDNELVKSYATTAVGSATDTLSKAKAIYEWTIHNLARIDNGEKIGDYTFEVEGCGYGDTVKILTDLQNHGIAGGHCTDINSTFVALCRAAGIPAREMFGIRMNDNATGGQHCWAEFYLPGTGWVFADPADVLKAVKPKKGEQIDIDAWNTARNSDTCAERTQYFWGTVDENRIVLSRGRDVTFEPAQAWGVCNTFGYPAGEVDGARSGDFTDAANFVYSISSTEIPVQPEPAPAPAPAPAAPAAVSEVSINSATVSAAAVQQAIQASGGNPDTLILGKKVKKIKKGAFAGTGIKTLVVTSKKLKKKSVKGSLKGSSVTSVKVKVGKAKANKKYAKKYKKFFTKKNAGKKAKVTKF